MIEYLPPKIEESEVEQHKIEGVRPYENIIEDLTENFQIYLKNTPGVKFRFKFEEISNTQKHRMLCSNRIGKWDGKETYCERLNKIFPQLVEKMNDKIKNHSFVVFGKIQHSSLFLDGFCPLPKVFVFYNYLKNYWLDVR